MASKLFPPLSYLFQPISLVICLWLLAPVIQANHDDQRKTYIIYMGDPIKTNKTARSHHIDMLSSVLDNVPVHKVSEHLLHTYENFHGCVAKLTENEAKVISGMDGVVSVFHNDKNYPHTTRSWDFMGFPLNVERSNMESDLIVGVIDFGIWPESESFRDDSGFGPPPTKWKGRCQSSSNFTCNNKIIGAQYFRIDGNVTEDGIASLRDTTGHGTHTASIAAGGVVKAASFLGFGQGTARGGVPSARIAVYKPCWGDDGCLFSDVLAAFDAAISDGVDIISISLGNTLIRPYFMDSIAIGGFHAMKKGILTSAAVGNHGPSLGTVRNHAPWLLSVGASTIDRKFTTKVRLGNGMVFEGTSINTFDLQNKTFPLIYGGDAPDTISSNSSRSRFCIADTLNRTLVKDKIVVCDALVNGTEAFVAGAAGTIMHYVHPHDIPYSFPLPASYIHADDAARVISYTRNFTSTTPFGTILKSVELMDKSTPYVASFSTRGPHPLSPRILKPDLVAPGVSIVAAWSPIAPVTGIEGDERSVSFNMAHGTSMACPHATAIAAYVKSFHPTWSAAAIKSALMTTASPMSNAMNEEAELAYGSGHINPSNVTNPGLVYDANEGDYVKFLCNEGLSDSRIRSITGDNSSCPENNTTNWDLNYPSISLAASLGAFDNTFMRTVTNVGSSNSTYKATVTTPQEGQSLAIKVQPSTLTFESVGQKLSFSVRVSGNIGMRALMSASLVWDDGQHQVRSPIVVFNLS